MFCLNAQNDVVVVNVFPHDTDSFTQGLFYYQGYLYEGTGLKKKSRLMKVDIKTGKAVQTVELKDTFFGEGIVRFNDRILQLTWTSSTGFIYDLNTLELIKSFTYASDGWGICFDGTNFIISDGSDKLSFYSIDPFQKLYDISATDYNGIAITRLNELEYVDGYVFANVYQTNTIVCIDPLSGSMVKRFDFTDQVNAEMKQNKDARELNGIAYNPESKTFYITGKNWSSLYEVRLKL